MCKSYEANSVNNESEEPTVMPVTNDILNNSPEVEQMEAKKLEELESALRKWEKQLLAREAKVNSAEIKNQELTKKLQNEAFENSKRSAELSAQEKAAEIDKTREKEKALADIQQEVLQKRGMLLKQLDEEIENQRKKRTDDLERTIEERRKTLEDSIKTFEQSFQERKNETEKNFEKARKNLNNEWKKLDDDKLNLETEQGQLSREMRKLEIRKKRFDDALEKEVKMVSEARIADYQSKWKAAGKQIEELTAALKERDDELKSYEANRLVYGNMEIVKKKNSDLTAANEALKKELSTRPGPEVIDECINLKKRIEELTAKLDSQSDMIQRAYSLESENEEQQRNLALKASEIENLKGCLEDYKNLLNSTTEELERLRASKVTPADREIRMDSIKQAYIPEGKVFIAADLTKEEVAQPQWNWDEIQWLDNLNKLCSDYGVIFPKRILYAYHTALKIANWSSITVLSGVSGTGKSELPHLYSRFGGLNFINVPVQPNWDSQESMLGFFNSIDNKFDAQPMLRFLYQCTNDPLKNTMSIALLDEMNLAHVEQYFADFLDKLETRRSSSSDIPHVDVSLGAGVAPYELPLSRNVLFCGTMNQDETTKALSDKVLDRGIVIFFPRPRYLFSRDGARNLEYFCRDKNIQAMPQAVWNNWREKQVCFIGDQRKELNRYKGMLEEVNNYLAEVGRAIGHRVWQSFEHYVANYPTVRKAHKEANGDLTQELKDAMHMAVEDQLVQKVMPKLRGIDTTGNGRDNCLDPILKLLDTNNFALHDDFERAMKLGYGQFIWCSADYIPDEE